MGSDHLELLFHGEVAGPTIAVGKASKLLSPASDGTDQRYDPTVSVVTEAEG